MARLWCIVGLIIATIAVSTLGAGFSVFGLSQLFSGAARAVIAMASSLELAKFMIAAYLHQTWQKQNVIFKSYLVTAIVVLSFITSMGIFGFLSNAYQSASSQLDVETIKSTSLKSDLARNAQEIDRLNHSVDEIPANRVSKRLQLRSEIEPEIKLLKAKAESINAAITDSDLKIIEVKQRVGPLIYIARAFGVDIDQVVKYLILVFVCVFDPLAICMVIATSQSLEFRQAAQGQTSSLPINEDANVVQMRFVNSKDAASS